MHAKKSQWNFHFFLLSKRIHDALWRLSSACISLMWHYKLWLQIRALQLFSRDQCKVPGKYWIRFRNDNGLKLKDWTDREREMNSVGWQCIVQCSEGHGEQAHNNQRRKQPQMSKFISTLPLLRIIRLEKSIYSFFVIRVWAFCFYQSGNCLSCLHGHTTWLSSLLFFVLHWSSLKF